MSLEQTAVGRGWKRVGVRHHHGIQVPLLSIWTEQSQGCGEFLDLIPLIDWLSDLGMDVLQLLPLNDSGEDASPYKALSGTALHPIYLSLHALTDEKLNFPKSKRVPYWEVLEKKLAFLKKYVADMEKVILEDPSYQAFVERSPHLRYYARYKVKTEGETENFHLIVQYLCHTQLLKAKKHAEKKGVFLKGDIPILLSPKSADVWAHPEFFDLSLQAGSPPTKFDPKGQVWKFPLYNWKAMEENHFEWWRRRIQTAAQYFHLYRIDHIIGFFRIWAIPHGEIADKGFFVPKKEGLMEVQGRKLLETLLSFSDMLPIGEDLGDPPPFIRETMLELGIPGTKILRWSPNIEAYPPASLSTVSTHDLEPSLSQEMVHKSHHTPSLFHINLLQEYLPPELTWGNPEDEVINIPGTENHFNWTYRYKCPLEVLTNDASLNERIKALVRLK